MRISRFRLATLAVTLLGAFQLRTAGAATIQFAEPCPDDDAVAIGAFACDYMTGGDWEYAVVSCDGSGNVTVTCAT